MSSVPEVIIEEVMSPSILSVAVAPGSAKVSPTVRLMVEEPVKVIVGGVVSGSGLTITVLIVETELPAASVTEYSMVYVPSVDVSTVPEEVIEEVMPPSILSSAIAPGSAKVSPTVRLMVEEPDKVIVGGVVSGIGLSLEQDNRINKIKRVSLCITCC